MHHYQYLLARCKLSSCQCFVSGRGVKEPWSKGLEYLVCLCVGQGALWAGDGGIGLYASCRVSSRGLAASAEAGLICSATWAAAVPAPVLVLTQGD